MIFGTRITTFCIAIFFSLSLAASAEQVTGLIKFENDTKADADEVNTNFSKIQKAINTNDLKDGGVVNGPLTVPSITYSLPKSASVTYSAMGFTPVSADIRFVKDIEDGSLSVNALSGGQFYHSVTLPTGVTITHIRAHIKDESGGAQVSVELKKKERGREPDPLVTLIANVSEGEDPEQVFEQDLENPESIEWSRSGSLPSYYVEVFLNGVQVCFYSVTIDYEYTDP